MGLAGLRDRLLGFARQALVWIVGILLVVFTSVALFAPMPVAERLAGIPPAARLLLIIILDAGVVSLIYLQIRRPPVGNETGLIVKTSGAITQVNIDSARERVLKAVSSLPDIQSASAQVQAVRGRADIQLDVVVHGDEVNVPNKQKEINRALQQVINKQLGLQMAGRPRIHIRFYDPGKPAVEAHPPAREEKRAAQPREVVQTGQEEKPGLGGLLGGLLRNQKREDEPVEKEAAPTTVADRPEVSAEEKTSGLLGGLLRGRREEVEKQEEQVAPPSAEVPTGGERLAESLSDSAMDKPDDKDDSWTGFAAVLEQLDERKAEDDQEAPSQDSPEEQDKNQPTPE